MPIKENDNDLNVENSNNTNKKKRKGKLVMVIGECVLNESNLACVNCKNSLIFLFMVGIFNIFWIISLYKCENSNNQKYSAISTCQ